jgi:hypothetical protein
MYGRKCKIADSDVLQKFGAEEIDGSCGIGGIAYKGWEFTSFHTRIIGSDKLAAMARRVSELCGTPLSELAADEDGIYVNGTHLHIPPMLFGDDVLNLRHVASNKSFQFDAEDAITCWAVQHGSDEIAEKILGPGAAGGSSFLPSVPQVPFAGQWANANAETLAESSIKANSKIWDWTFTSDYCCTVNMGDSKVLCTGRQLSSEAEQSAPRIWRALESSEPSGIDRTLLSRREDILFYDEMLLYGDDLEDCGEVTVDIKVRVMPSCWFVLLRTFVRVDGAIIRIRDTRLFHIFGSNHVSMEVQWREADSDACERLVAMSTAAPSHDMAMTKPSPGIHPGLVSISGQVPSQSGIVPSVFQNSYVPTINLRDANSLIPLIPEITTEVGLMKNFEFSI